MAWSKQNIYYYNVWHYIVYCSSGGGGGGRSKAKFIKNRIWMQNKCLLEAVNIRAIY